MLAIPKIAMKADERFANYNLLKLANEHVGEVVVVGMDGGFETRVQGPGRGSYLTYASFRGEAAPGQPSLLNLVQTWIDREYI